MIGVDDGILRDMKKVVISCFTWLALIGVLHCVVVEPVLAVQSIEASETTHEAEADACLACCVMHHQWLLSNANSFDSVFISSEKLILADLLVPPSPVLASIFHPPAFL